MLKDWFHPNPNEGVKQVPDIEYGPYGSTKLDIFVPEKSERPLPMIVYIPGGAWFGCDKNLCLPFQFGFCQQGYATASLSYRVSTEAPFPAQIEDIKAAIRWIRANAGTYNIDPNRIGVMGTSAGGHLACLLGVTGKARQFDVGEHLEQSSAVQAVCNFYGATDFLHLFDQFPVGAEKIAYMREMIDRLLGGPLAEKTELARQASPINYIDENSPPFLTVHGTVDEMVPFRQAELLHDKLRQNGVVNRLFPVPDAGHGEDQLFTENLFDEVFRFFDEQLIAESIEADSQNLNNR